MNEGTLEEKVAAIAAAVAPLNVVVDLRHVDNTYTIYIDGRATYTDPATWDDHWGGFDKFVSVLLSKYRINPIGKYCNGLVGEVYLGTLFDMISA